MTDRSKVLVVLGITGTVVARFIGYFLGALRPGLQYNGVVPPQQKARDYRP